MNDTPQFKFVELNARRAMRGADAARVEVTEQGEGMTLRQYAAIKLKVPNSGTEWLDEMIRESLRDDFAADAMQGLIESGEADRILKESDLDWTQSIAWDSYTTAMSMLAARAKP